jgi:hypothetical protein
MTEPENLDPKHRQFLLELRELTLKHGISIDGCGCCGSPFLSKIDSPDPLGGYMALEGGEEIIWIQPSSKEWSRNSQEVITPQNSEINP